ncbi:DUF418 domain-containing protein [Herbiconiux sp.]|uniref:DUF418 domain-containing protein n=1 Tax=Herbiconiux sp. TaxID=1871186 RepID=UPI0025C55DDA|nr:DUF418 domain-containing protein [Herbiconiux sp.]
MIAAHTVPEDGGEAVWDGRSSVLFALVAGISLGLISGGSARSRSARVVALRALLLIVLGIGLTLLETPIAIILDSYGLLFAVSIPLLFAPRWLLGVVAAVAAVAGPWLVTILTAGVDAASGDVARLLQSPWAYFPEAWLYGVYPAPVWLAYVATGILIARCDLRRPRTQAGMLVIGGVLAAAGYLGALLGGAPVEAHSNTTSEVVATGGLAVAITGLLLLVLSPGAARGRQVTRTIARPLAAAGSMPLTLYSAQIIAIAIIVRLSPAGSDGLDWQATPLFFALAVPAVVFASVWSLRFSQGPLEWLVSRLSTQRPWRAPRSTGAQH